jgi:hypothetical protein
VRSVFDAAADLEGFLTEWHGSPRSSVQIAAGPWPFSLRHWHACAEAWGSALTHQNSMRPLGELDMTEEVLVFYDENQHVCSWGCGRGDDPDVMWQYNHEPNGWKPVGEKLSTFLCHVALYEAAFGGPFERSLGDGPASDIRLCLQLLRPAPHPRWAWPDSRVYLGIDVVALCGSNAPPGTAEDEDESWYIIMAGRSEKALLPFDQFGLEWV